MSRKDLSERVLLIASFPDSILAFRGPLIEALIAEGCEVHVAAPGIRGAPDIVRVLQAIGAKSYEIPLRRTGKSPIADMGLFIALLRLMRRIRPTVTLPYTIKPVIYGTLAAWLVGVPRRYALVTGLGYAFTGERVGFLKGVIIRLYLAALSRVNKVFFQNPDDERYFREIGILPEHVPSIVTNGSGVDISTYPFRPIPEASPVFLMIGRLLGDKGVREYAEAARIVKERNPSARFLLVGWIDENPDAIGRPELDDWISVGAIEFLGRLEDVRHSIEAASVYVLPSYREGTPRTVLEAMAMGRPIITTDAPGCRETVVDGENGLLVPVKSADALVKAMLKFIADPALAARMGRRSREIAEEKYDVRKVNAVLLSEMEIALAAKNSYA